MSVGTDPQDENSRPADVDEWRGRRHLSGWTGPAGPVGPESGAWVRRGLWVQRVEMEALTDLFDETPRTAGDLKYPTDHWNGAWAKSQTNYASF